MGRGDFYNGMPGWRYYSRATPGHPASINIYTVEPDLSEQRSDKGNVASYGRWLLFLVQVIYHEKVLPSCLCPSLAARHENVNSACRDVTIVSVKVCPSLIDYKVTETICVSRDCKSSITVTDVTNM